MNWIELLGAVGIGAIVTKLLDVVWPTRIQERHAARKWLRDNKLGAFSKLARALASLGLDKFVTGDLWKLRALSSEAELLIEDEELVSKLRQFINDLFISYKVNQCCKSSRYT